MSVFTAIAFVCLALLPGTSQTAPTIRKDAQALATLSQSIQAMGGIPAANSVNDFNATGSITYFWAGQEVKGNATLSGKGKDQFRMDASVGQGTRSWVINHESGSLMDFDGKARAIPPHNAVSVGSSMFPLFSLLDAANNPSTILEDRGIVTLDNQQFRELHLHRDLRPELPGDAVNRLLDSDYFFDPQTFLLIAIQNNTHPLKTMTKDVPHALYFSDYRQRGGVLVPFSITEYIGNQRVSALQLSDVQFNTGLTDAKFQF